MAFFNKLLDDPDPRVRANVIEALAAARDPDLVGKLRPLLQDPSTRARINTVLTIAAIQGVSGITELMPLIRDLMEGDAKSRSTATYALSRLPMDSSMDLLGELLKDPELRVRCEAAQALGRIGSPRVVSGLVEALAGPPELRRQARRSLAAIIQRCGIELTRELEATALSSDRAEIRSELADVLGRAKDPAVVETLIKLLKDPEWRVRWKVLKSFERLARDRPLAEIARSALFKFSRDELASFRQSLLWSQALVPRPATQADWLLAEALEEDRVNIEERVFHMLGILCGRDRMLAIFEKLKARDARTRADALEALDTLAPREVGRELLALLEPTPTAKGTSPAAIEPVLSALARHPKPWMRACTAYFMGCRPEGDGDRLLNTLLGDPDPLVRETSLYAGCKAFGNAWRPQVDAASQSSDPALRLGAEKLLARGSPGNGENASPYEKESCDADSRKGPRSEIRALVCGPRRRRACCIGRNRPGAGIPAW